VELYGQIAAYVADSLWQDDVEVNGCFACMKGILIHDYMMLQPKYHKQIQCLSATCKDFNTEVKKRLRPDHLVVIKKFWDQTISSAHDVSRDTYHFREGDVDDLQFERLWYGEYPKSLCVMLHKKSNLFTMQCGRKEYEGPKICFRITNGTPIDGKMADDVQIGEIVDQVVNVNPDSVHDDIKRWLMQQRCLYLRTNLLVAPSADIRTIDSELEGICDVNLDCGDCEWGKYKVPLWKLVQWSREQTNIGPWKSQLINASYPLKPLEFDKKWGPEDEEKLLARVMSGQPVEITPVWVNIVDNEARVVKGVLEVRTILAFFNNDIRVKWRHPQSTDKEHYYLETYAELVDWTQTICRNVYMVTSVFDNLSVPESHEVYYESLD
jgi:hypothetical protein